MKSIQDINNALMEEGKEYNYAATFDEPDYWQEPSTYDEYNGSYVQDVMHWSDQDIEDALDGMPDAYWNID